MPTTVFFFLCLLPACLFFSRPPKYASSTSTGPASGSGPARVRHDSLNLCSRNHAELYLIPRSRYSCMLDMPLGRVAIRYVVTAQFR